MRTRLGLIGLLGCAVLAGVAVSAQDSAPPAQKTELPKRGDACIVDLPTVLRLAHAQNLDVQIARERLAEAKANRTSATWQFFPYISPGISYRKHEGRVQSVEGDVFDASKGSYTPGVTLGMQVDLGEAYYRELAARQQVEGADQGIAAQQSTSALVAAQSYFDLLFAQAAADVARDALRISTNYQDQAEQAVDAGVAFRGDALRVKVQAQRNRLAIEQAEQQRKLASARLVEVLHLEPGMELVPENDEIVPLALVDTNAALKSLVQQALANRAELKQSGASANAARLAAKGAIYGPMVPTIGAQVFAGGLGGGTGGDLGNFGDQQDYVVGLSWRIGPGGMFDTGRTKATESRAKSSELLTEKLQADIARQVIEAAVKAQSLRRQIDIAHGALQSADDGLKLAQMRREFAVGVVLENIQAEQDLTRARLDYLSAIADYNKAQYQLKHAIGQGL